MATLIGVCGASLGALAAVLGNPKVSLAVAVAGVLVAAIGVFLSYKWKKEGVGLASQANEIATKAGTASAENARRVRALSVRLERLSVFEDRRQRLRDHRRGFKDYLAAIEGAGRDSEDVDGDIVQRSRMLSRSFRSAMEHYGESWEIFQALKDDLEPDTVDALEKGMRQAAALFAENFSPAQVRGVALAHGGVLDCLMQAVEEALARWKREIGDEVGGRRKDGVGE